MSTEASISEQGSNETKELSRVLHQAYVHLGEELTREVRQELDRYGEKGQILRFVGTGSAIAGGAAVVLPLMLSLTTTIPLVAFAGAGYALLEQSKRDRNIRQWNERLEDILQFTDFELLCAELYTILREIKIANA